MERLKGQVHRATGEAQRHELQEQVRLAQQVLVLRSMLTSAGNKTAIAKEFLNRLTSNCLRKGLSEVINQDQAWLAMPSGYDLNVETLAVRQRELYHNMVGLTKAVFTVPSEMVDRVPTREERSSLFGPIPGLFNQLAAGNATRAQDIVVSLYLQLLGHNRAKYLIAFTGQGGNGKSLLLTLLRECLGELCAPLHKSILFSTKDFSSHSGFQVQLDSIRSGLFDDCGHRDTFNEQAVKTIVSPDCEMVLREAGHIRRGAAKARYRIGCSIIVAYNKGSFPQIQMDQALVNRFRVIPFAALFTAQMPLDPEPGRVYYPAKPHLLEQLKQPTNMSYFFNYICMAGRHYYRAHIQKLGEPLVNEPHIQAELEGALEAGTGPASSAVIPLSQGSSFDDWWDRHVQYAVGAMVPIANLASAYMATGTSSFRDPTKEFGMLLQAHKPHLVQTKKRQLMTTVDGIRAKRMVLLDYELVMEPAEWGGKSVMIEDLD
jgi:hypothetical protein